jgi:hypothetical protein
MSVRFPESQIAKRKDETTDYNFQE